MYTIMGIIGLILSFTGACITERCEEEEKKTERDFNSGATEPLHSIGRALSVIGVFMFLAGILNAICIEH